ncbi:MAG: DUF1553 domain-containing protein [Gemmatales bacterium]|nr:DUF1553 domain-containing protein [Gemmatales bacterium]MDW8387263.1 DUF1553 domain-containing protein [Gemmatales bacterium]
MTDRGRTLIALVALCGAIFSARNSAYGEEKLRYNRDIRPILAENCFACHGPDSAARKAGLRLDRRDDAMQGAIVPGKPDESPLIERIFSTDENEIMPPVKSFKRLTEEQKNLLKRWVAEGAEYEPHWSYIPPKRPPIPTVKNPQWVRNPIDAFILAELEKRGLQPAPEADRYTLARRLSLDLIGLPPDPADVEAFVNDPAPDAYERFVDKLLKSPHWGEHRGRYWLDAARYADTHGIHFDNYREMWSYRDWVIRAFNQNMPFDQFTIEQLAGDLLPNPTLEQKIATGFNRCNITTNEGGVIPEEYLVLYTRDRVETTSQVWMGLTAGCAVCHEHKLDPMTQKEFYEVAAFFNNTTQGAMDGNIKDTPPIVVVPRPEDRARWDALGPELADARKAVEDRKKNGKDDFQKWVASIKPEDLLRQSPRQGLALHVPLQEGEGEAIRAVVGDAERSVIHGTGFDWELQRDGRKAFRIKEGPAPELPDVGDFDRTTPFAVAAWVFIPQGDVSGAIVARMDDGNAFRGWDLWVQNRRIGMHVIHRWPDDAVKVVSQNPLQQGKWYHVAAVYDGTGTANGIKIYVNGEEQKTNAEVNQLKSTTRTTVPFKIGQRHGSAKLHGFGIYDLRIYTRKLEPGEVLYLAKDHRAAELLAKPAEQRTDKETEELYSWWLVTKDDVYKQLTGRVEALQAEEAAIKNRGTVAHVMQEKNSEPMAYVLFRGEYDKRRDPVKPNTPSFLPPFPADFPKNRLGFARWLLLPEHPLTARVQVNRFWQEVFGTGLVKTSHDFGIAGELPSHPELLDWLAVQFRESGWDVKGLFRLMVTSSTYRQAAVTTPEKLEKDRENRLLSRGPRFRMDAEMIRDYALAASGLLVRKIGGPSVKPYQPPGVWEAVAMIGSNTRNYQQDKGENLYRRSLYTFWKRSAPPASMEILNAPNRETCVMRRERTNTPLQALVTLNDVQFVEAARVLAEKALKEGGDTTARRLDYIARRVLIRPLRPEESAVIEGLLRDLMTHYQDHQDEARKLIAFGEMPADATLDPATLAAWTMTVNQMLNLDEVLNK